MKNINSVQAGLAIILALQTITGCKVSKDVTTPDMALPGTYTYHRADTSNIAAMPWNSFFADQQLKSLIAEAIAHNNDLQLAIKDIEAADLTLRQAKLGNIPTIGLQAAATTNRPSDNSLNGLSLSQFDYQSKHIEDYNVSAYLSWEADLWGKIRSQKAAALAGFLITDEAKKAIQTRIVSSVAKGYYNLLMLDKQLNIARKNALLNDSTLTIIRLQFDAGQATTLAIEQARAQLLLTRALVPQFEQAISIQENALGILTGALPHAIPHNGDLSDAAFSGTSGTGIPADLLSRRPDVKVAELAVQEENGRVGYTKAFMYPSLTITAQGGLDAIKASNWFNIPASLFGTFTGSLLQPLFQQKKLKTAYEVEKVKRDQAVIRFRQQVLIAVGEVENNLLSIDKLQRQIAFSTERVTTLQRATQNSKILFSNGQANYLEVITAQSNALQGELDLAHVQRAILDAKVDLYRSVGGGWQ